MSDIAELVSHAEVLIKEASSSAELDEVRTTILGKKSDLALAQRALGGMDPETRKDRGKQLQEARQAIEEQLNVRRGTINLRELDAARQADRLDLTEIIVSEVRSPTARGHLHLVSQTQNELEDVFVGMGFDVAEGPEIETDWYNFGALNIPPAHPARGMWDTFYLDLGAPETVLLRTHTSNLPVSIEWLQRPNSRVAKVAGGSRRQDAEQTYSERRAWMTSTREARAAGNADAIIAAARSSSAEAATGNASGMRKSAKYFAARRASQ